MRFFVRLLFAAAIFGGVALRSTLVNAQEEDGTAVLPAVIVEESAERGTPAVPAVEDARAQITRTPGGVDVVDVREVKKGRTSTVQDLLGYSPGVFVQPRFGAEESRLSIRGSGLQRTFHLRGVKLLQDGVPVNQADGGGDFQSIEPLALQYAEVYRGANALAYGATTLGGAINMISHTGYSASRAQARAEAGNHGYFRAQLSTGVAEDPLDYYLSLSYLDQDGFRAHSAQENRRVFANVGARLGEAAETRFYLTVLDSRSQLPGNLTKAQLDANPSQASATNVTNNQKRDFDLIRLANRTVFEWGPHRLEGAAFWITKDLYHPIFQVLDVVSSDLGFETRYINGADLAGFRNKLVLGLTPVWGFADDDRFANLGGERGARTAETLQRAYNLDAYAENHFYFARDAAFVAGAQLAYAVREADDQFLANGDNSGRQVFRGFSPKLGFLWDARRNVQVFTNVSRSFEPPSFGELANVAAGGIVRLDPQRATTFEVGSRGSLERVDWDAVYYYAWLSDELLSQNDAAGNPLGTTNATETRHQGVELGAALTFWESILAEPAADGENGSGSDELKLRGTYLWSDFAFADDPVYTDNHLPGIPPHLLRAELVYQHPSGFYAGPNLEWSFIEYPVDLANTLFADRYAVLGAKAGWRGRNGISVFVEVRNLTDEHYAATTGAIADARGADSAQFLPGDGRTWVAGAELKW